MQDSLIEFLSCPVCRSAIRRVSAERLVCEGCGRETVIRDGVPRFVPDVVAGANDVARRTQASFGYEWTHFNDWRPSGLTNFADYFGHFDLEWLRGRAVLDGGCGMGRHARQIASFAQTVVAVDFSSAIDEAASNVADRPNVHRVQADLRPL